MRLAIQRWGQRAASPASQSSRPSSSSSPWRRHLTLSAALAQRARLIAARSTCRRPKDSSSGFSRTLSARQNVLSGVRGFMTAPEGLNHDFAFAFDIDGVLLRANQSIPGAAEALKFLQARNIPFILLTNGGGKHEEERVTQLSDILQVPLSVEQLVQSHTPFRLLVDGGPKLRRETVLVTGQDGAKCREIAERYGFEKVVIPADIVAAQPEIFPFNPLLNSVYAAQARPLPKPIFRPDSGVALQDTLKIAAIFVFNDPRDWALDTQIITDLLCSHQGHLGTFSPKNKEPKWQQDDQPALYFSNNDLLWSAGYHLPRLGQGAFRIALSRVWEDGLTNMTYGLPVERRILAQRGRRLRCSVYGKPKLATFSYADKVLHRWVKKTVPLPDGKERPPHWHLRNVFMVGDNPASDILGANMYRQHLCNSGLREPVEDASVQDGPWAQPEAPDKDGAHANTATPWMSVLVQTGVCKPEDLPLNVDLRTPNAIAADVQDAIRKALSFSHRGTW